MKNLVNSIIVFVVVLISVQVQAQELKIKGFYLGMNIDEATQVFRQAIPTLTVDVYPNDDYLGCTGLKLRPSLNAIKNECINIQSNEDRIVNYIDLTRSTLDCLFNTEGLPTKEWIIQFISAYDIPKVEAGNGEYYYTDPDNKWVIKFVLGDNGELSRMILKTIGSEQSQTPSFGN